MRNLISLENKTALVTGGSRGVGRETCRMLARAGARVGFCYQSRKDDAAETVRLIENEGGSGWAVQSDLASEEGVSELFRKADTEFPEGLDIFVANAGLWEFKEVSMEDMSPEQWHRTIRMNLDSVFLLTREAGRRMHNGGRIIYIGSTAGQRGEAYHADYAATKGALISMVKSLCVEYGERDITVNCVAPGWVDTEMAAPALAGGRREAIERGIPLKRIASAEDVAGPVFFLCTALARHITGEVLNVNGGSVLCG